MGSFGNEPKRGIYHTYRLLVSAGCAADVLLVTERLLFCGCIVHYQRRPRKAKLVQNLFSLVDGRDIDGAGNFEQIPYNFPVPWRTDLYRCK